MSSGARSFVMLTSTGCLLPFLVFFNLFFGWLFLKPVVWLFVEAFLILLLALNSFMVTRRILSARGKDDRVVDVEGEVIDEKKQLK